MTSTDQAPTSDRPNRRRWRRLGFVLIILAALETGGWIADHLFGFHQKLVWRLTLMELESVPTDDAVATSSDPGLWIRSANEDSEPTEPYRVGQTVIEGAGPWIEHQRLTPRTCPGPPGERTFVLGGSAAFGYPYRFEKNFAARADRPTINPEHRVLNAARVGATSNDLVPIANTILEHYNPATLVILAGNNEWFHWRPRRPANATDKTDPADVTIDDTGRTILATLAHSRALAAIISGLLHLLQDGTQQTAPRRIVHDDGFVEHHALLGARHAIENPLTPSHYDAATWPGTRQRYLDRFRDNLVTIITTAKRKNVRVVLMTMPFQYRLAPAWKQRQPLSGQPRHLETMTRLVTETLKLQDQGQPAGALETIRQAIKLDPLPPVPHYLEAVLLESLDRPREAEASYARSREAMIGNLGSRLSINRVIREVAADQQTDLVDLRKVFDEFQHHRQRFFNVELIHDDCHPTSLAHGLIAHHLDKLLFGGPATPERH